MDSSLARFWAKEHKYCISKRVWLVYVDCLLSKIDLSKSLLFHRPMEHPANRPNGVQRVDIRIRYRSDENKIRFTSFSDLISPSSHFSISLYKIGEAR